VARRGPVKQDGKLPPAACPKSLMPRLHSVASRSLDSTACPVLLMLKGFATLGA
jgi:hypothetical protein